MWKTCQEAHPKTKVMTIDGSPLTRQTTQRILASFAAGLDILIIEGKKQKRLSPTAGPFSFPERTMNAPRSNPLPAPGSRLPATGSQTPAPNHLFSGRCHSPKHPRHKAHGISTLPQSHAQGGGGYQVGPLE